MPAIVQGRIVFPLDPIPDPQGRNPKARRPFVVISPPQDILSGAPLAIIGISSTFHGGEDEVELPYGPNCQTGLRQASAAICSWMVSVGQDRVEVGKGYVKPVLLQRIMLKAREYPHGSD